MEEMAEENLDIVDIETAIFNGKITGTEKGDPRGTKYILEGTGSDGQIPVGAVGRFTNTGRYLIITVYVITEA